MPSPMSLSTPAASPSLLGELRGLLLELAREVVVLLQLAQLVVPVDEVGELARVVRQVLTRVFAWVTIGGTSRPISANGVRIRQM